MLIMPLHKPWSRQNIPWKLLLQSGEARIIDRIGGGEGEGSAKMPPRARHAVQSAAPTPL